MAPRKPTTTTKPAKKSITTESSKVVKRPARGYHKYKNGLLNVTPKGGEMELVKKNQDSPLLRLPPEIRTRIWEYALGHSIFSVQVTYSRRSCEVKSIPPEDELSVGVALLRCCRQIYSEAALMPLRLNTLAFWDVRHVKKVTKLLKVHQRKQIARIQVKISSYDGYTYACFCNQRMADSLTQTFPALKNIEVIVFDAKADTKHSLKEIETHIRRNYAELLGNNGITLTVKGLDLPMPSTYYQY